MNQGGEHGDEGDAVTAETTTAFQVCPRCLTVFRDPGPGSITPQHEEPWSGKPCLGFGRPTRLAEFCYDIEEGYVYPQPVMQRAEAKIVPVP